VLNTVVLASVAFGFYYVAWTIIREVISLASSIQQNWSSIVVKYDQLLEQFTVNAELLPAPLIGILEDAKDSILVFVQDLTKNVVGFTVSTTKSSITSTGTFFVNLITFFLALFFIGLDANRITEFAEKHTSERAKETFRMLKTSVVSAIGGFMKAQLILALFAFVFMLLALTIYGQPYALTIALLLGLIDLLPVLGTIAILLPWGGIEFFMGDVNKGVFLIVIGVAFFLIRKVVEPKVMGDQTGLPPLLALLGTYIGLQFSGVWGAVLGPVVLMLLIRVTKSGLFTNTASDLRAAYNDVSKLFRPEE
jgi:sporulation integral membrane protein YtvI